MVNYGLHHLTVYTHAHTHACKSIYMIRRYMTYKGLHTAIVYTVHIVYAK